MKSEKHLYKTRMMKSIIPIEYRYLSEGSYVLSKDTITWHSVSMNLTTAVTKNKVHNLSGNLNSFLHLWRLYITYISAYMKPLNLENHGSHTTILKKNAINRIYTIK